VGFTATGVRPLGVGIASGSMGYVFLSHSRWDRPDASRVVTWLQDSGIPVWISGLERHCPAWRDSILPNIADSSVVVVLMTPRSELADGVREEVFYAGVIGKPVIPLSPHDYSFLSESGCQMKAVPGSVIAGNLLLGKLRKYVELAEHG
jgi:hypothetical protein